MMNDYNPDYWQVVKITQPTGESVYKLFSTWAGGYAKGDSWKLNSGITKIVEEEQYLEIHGASGSVYHVPNNSWSYRTVMYTQSVLDHFQREMTKAGGSLQTVPFDAVKTEIKDSRDIGMV